MRKLLSVFIFMITLVMSIEIKAQTEVDPNFVVLTMQVAGEPGCGTTEPRGVRIIKSFNDSVYISAQAAAGYKFLSWRQKGRGLVADCSAAATTVTLAGNSVVTAVFVPEDEDSVSATLTVTTSTEGAGSVTPAETITLPVGKAQEITATATTGYKFVYWQIAGPAFVDNIYAASTNITLNGTTTLTAIFAKDDDVVSLDIKSGDGGTVLDAGTYYVIKGDSRNISALPLPDYIFSGWQISGLSVINTEYSPEAEITLYEDTVVTASFQQYTCPYSHKGRRIYIKKSDISEGNGGYVKNKDRVNAKNLPMCLNPSNFNPNTDTLKVIIDGNTFSINKENGLFKRYRHGYHYTSFSKIPRLKLTLNFTRGVWSFTGSKVELNHLDNSDGVDVMLNSGTAYYGQNYNLEEKLFWNFNNRKNSASPLNSSGTAMAAFDIVRADGSIHNNRENGDRITIYNAVIAFPDGSDVQIDALDVTVTVAGQCVILPKGSFVKNQLGQYIYKNKKQKLTIKINPGRKRWSMTMSKFNGWGNFTPSEPINIFLTVGSYQAGETIYPTLRRTLIYKYNKIYWSNK